MTFQVDIPSLTQSVHLSLFVEKILTTRKTEEIRCGTWNEPLKNLNRWTWRVIVARTKVVNSRSIARWITRLLYITTWTYPQRCLLLIIKLMEQGGIFGAIQPYKFWKIWIRKKFKMLHQYAYNNAIVHSLSIHIIHTFPNRTVWRMKSGKNFTCTPWNLPEMINNWNHILMFNFKLKYVIIHVPWQILYKMYITHNFTNKN